MKPIQRRITVFTIEPAPEEVTQVYRWFSSTFLETSNSSEIFAKAIMETVEQPTRCRCHSWEQSLADTILPDKPC
jgi:hypothetical protein